jgi:hypothetical protein
MSIDSDGAPTSYAPPGSGLKALDVLGDGGWPHTWYGGPKGPDGKWIIQGTSDPAPGYIVTSTSWQNGPNDRQTSYVPADTVPYWVIPETTGMAPLGSVGIAYRPKFSSGVFGFVVADEGPPTHYGEGSMALASKLGVDPSPVDGGCSGGIYTLLFIGNKIEFGTWDQIQGLATGLFDQWGGLPRLQSVIHEVFG